MHLPCDGSFLYNPDTRWVPDPFPLQDPRMTGVDSPDTRLPDTDSPDTRLPDTDPPDPGREPKILPPFGVMPRWRGQRRRTCCRGDNRCRFLRLHSDESGCIWQ